VPCARKKSGFLRHGYPRPASAGVLTGFTGLQDLPRSLRAIHPSLKKG